MNIIQEWADVFNNQVGTRTNVLDLASHYPFSPERWRLFKNGTRQFVQYNSISEYNHAGDVHELTPSGGDTVVLESAERPRYVVQYELAATWAFRLNQSLQSGDKLIVGLYDGSDGWYMEHNGSHSDTEADFVMERSGTEVYRKEDIDIKKTVKSFARLRLATGWYDVTRQAWERSYTKQGDQRNPRLGKYSADDSKGPVVGNLPLRFEITAAAGTSGLRLDAGSCAQVNLGETTPLRRSKQAVKTVSVGTTGSWVPLFALRIDPGRDITNVQIRDVAIPEFDTSADIEVTVQSCDPSKVQDSNGNTLTDSDYSPPETHSSQGSVVEVSTAVAQFPDSTGTVGTSASDPGGFQVGRASLFTGGGNTVQDNSRLTGGVKRPLYGRDTAVVLANAGGTGDVTVEYRVEQDW